MVLTQLSGRRIWATLLLCIACTVLMVSCSAPWARHRTHKQPTTAQVIAALQRNFRKVNSFHVTMQVDNPGPASSGQIAIHSADGDVVMPDKVSVQATVVMSGQSVSVKLISVGSQQFVTDPVTGQWRAMKGLLDPRTLTNPDTGIVSLVGKMQKVSTPVEYSVNGTSCWRIDGLLDAKDLAFFTGGGVPSGTMLKTSVCAGATNALPYEVKVVGQAARGDTANTTRSFLLSNFNEQITITAPQA